MDGINKDPMGRWIFMFETNLMFSLDEKEIRKWSQNLGIDKVIRIILKSKRVSKQPIRKDFSTIFLKTQP